MPNREGYKQLTYGQRCQIYALKKRGFSNRQIGEDLGVSHTTVGREMRRNSGRRGYRCNQAEGKCQTRRHDTEGKHRKLTPSLIRLIEEKLRDLQLSPEQIAGWLANRGGVTVSPESIYRRIWRDKRAGGDLWKNLRRKTRRYQKRGSDGRTSRGRIPGRIDIDQRPVVVEKRVRIGDWEADTIIGANSKGAIVSLVERKSRKTRLVKVGRRTAQAVKAAIVASLRPHKNKTSTITFDNGKEFTLHQKIGKSLQADTFFAKPYHSWERGTNENTNGLVRQYFPKKTNFATITQGDVRRVERLLNNRPRKCLDFKTPNQVFRTAS
jgi:IS30 family transposase